MTYTIQVINQNEVANKIKYFDLFFNMAIYEEQGNLQDTIAMELLKLKSIKPESSTSNLLIARTESGAILGYALYYGTSHDVEFYVIPNWRRKGVGTALLDVIRDVYSGYSTLSGNPGFEGWKEFYTKNFVYIKDDDSYVVSREDADKYDGNIVKAYKAKARSAKLRLSAQLRKTLDLA